MNQRSGSNDLLLVIDFQNVYMPGQEWACPSLPEAVKNTRRILEAENSMNRSLDILFTKYLASEDPAGTWRVYNEEYRSINEDSFLCDIVKDLKPFAEKHPTAVKSTYSSMKSDQVLKAAQGKERLILTGVVAECCILSTMMEAIDLGYQVVYLYDCIAGQTPENEAAIRKIAESFAPMHTLVMSSDEYLKSR